MEGLYTREQAADKLGMSTDTLDRERARGAIAYIQRRPGCKVFFSTTAIQEYLARNTRPATPPQEIRVTYRRRRPRKEVPA